jgi:hypothetical protein
MTRRSAKVKKATAMIKKINVNNVKNKKTQKLLLKYNIHQHFKLLKTKICVYIEDP